MTNTGVALQLTLKALDCGYIVKQEPPPHTAYKDQTAINAANAEATVSNAKMITDFYNEILGNLE